MKNHFLYLKSHFREDFHLWIYLFTGLYLAAAIFFNYNIINLESTVINKYYGQNIRIVYYFLLYAAGFYPVVYLNYYFRSKPFKLDRKFWLFSLSGLFIISLDAGSHHFNDLYLFFPEQIKYFIFKIISNGRSILTVFLPLIIFKYYFDKKPNDFYGLNLDTKHFSSYFLMLGIMAPLIVWASFQDDFREAYPVYTDYGAHNFLEIPEWINILIFEFFYGIDFVFTELLFRGYFVIGMAAVLGKDAILPMVSTYAFLHFGKPAAETFGSIAGGYILGVFAFYSRNIWGGIFIHLGIAWLMEAAAFFTRNY
ncbi:MAG: type II CAAX prenyl endopeptidase Rce1 family protein [Cytophagaceae bacterium]